jgi:class 3 adenylate cyclase
VDRTCASCDALNPEVARFCMRCGAALESPPSVSAERRIVTVLFVDLVGFTERSDHADPEDVRRTLVPFHEAAKTCLARFGGTLDKFIGDAVMGVFGAPVAHEDDPSRALDAAFAILDAIAVIRESDPEIAVRIAVNTGEAVVTYGTGPQVGEAVAGDVVNTASRIQSLAPRDGVVIGEQTARAVRSRFTLDELPQAIVKGKSEPLRIWRVIGRMVDAAVDESVTSFVGRREELGALVAGYRRAVAGSTPHAFVIVGEPGVGKSRLLRELRERLRQEAPSARWFATRCHPYGESSLRPVVRLVQGALGVNGIEDDEPVTARLDAALVAVADDEREGVRTLLERFIGMSDAEQDPGTLGDLARAIAMLIGPGEPCVLAVEDVHWAEPTLLELLRGVRDELSARPIMWVTTARATEGEPFDGATVVPLGPLEAEETQELVEELVQRLDFADVPTHAVAERAGGNPLYALEFVRALADRDETERFSTSLPETVQAVIGARLDVVPADLRAAVLDAAVIGPDFWAPAIAAIDGGDEARAEAALARLAERGVVRAGPPSWFRTIPTHRFTHALFREVAYARLPRLARARKHLRVAEWIESASGDRSDERADAIAHHYEQAFALADAAGDHDLAAAARPPAASWLLRAGTRSAWLDALGSFERFDRALDLAEPGSGDRARILVMSAWMGGRAGALAADEALARLDEGVSIARSLSDASLLGWALVRQYSQMAFMGDGVSAEPLLDKGIEALEIGSASQALAEGYAYRAENQMLAGDTGASLTWAERAIDVARDVGADTTMIMALHIRGNARCELAGAEGLDDLREALRRSEELGSAADIVYSRSYLGEWLWLLESPDAGLEQIDAALDLTARRRVGRQYLWLLANALGPLFDAGRWRELDERIAYLWHFDPGRIDPTLLCVADVWAAKVAIARGDVDALPDAGDLANRARGIGEMHVVAPCLSAAALIALVMRDRDASVRFLEELETATASVSAPTYREEIVADATRAGIAAGAIELAGRFAAGAGTTARAHAAYATAHASIQRATEGVANAVDVSRIAVDRWRTYAAPYELALARDALGDCLDATGRGAEAATERDDARRLLAEIGAARAPGPFGSESIA